MSRDRLKAAPAHARGFGRLARWGDPLFRVVTVGFALTIAAIFLLVLAQMFSASLPAIREFGFSFLVGTVWNPVGEEFGGLPFLYGTLVSSLVALVIAIPLSLGVAIFLAEIASPGVRGPAGLLVELLAAIPSVVYGLWGIFVLVPWLRSVVEPFLGRYLAALS